MGWKKWLRENVEDGTEIGTWDGGGDSGGAEVNTEEYATEIEQAILEELGYEGFDGNWSTSGTIVVSDGKLVLEGDETNSENSVETGDKYDFEIELSAELAEAIIEIVCPHQMHGSECDNMASRLTADKTKQMIPFIYLIVSDGLQPYDLDEVSERLYDICLEIAQDGQSRDCGSGETGPFSHMEISAELVEAEQGGHKLVVTAQAYDDECTRVEHEIDLDDDDDDDDDDEEEGDYE